MGKASKECGGQGWGRHLVSHVIEEINPISLLSLAREFVNQHFISGTLTSVQLYELIVKTLGNVWPMDIPWPLETKALSFLKNSCLASGLAVINLSQWVTTSSISILQSLSTPCSSGAQLKLL